MIFIYSFLKTGLNEHNVSAYSKCVNKSELPRPAMISKSTGQSRFNRDFFIDLRFERDKLVYFLAIWLSFTLGQKYVCVSCFSSEKSIGIVGRYYYLSRLMTKPTKWHVRPAKTQISLGIRPVWSESSLSAWRKLVSLATHWAQSQDSDQTGRIWVFAGRTVILLVLSWGDSFYFLLTF